MVFTAAFLEVDVFLLDRGVLEFAMQLAKQDGVNSWLSTLDRNHEGLEAPNVFVLVRRVQEA